MRFPNRSVLATAIIAAATACAPMKAQPPHEDLFVPSSCNAGLCRAQVTVIDCARGQLAVTPDPIEVPGPNNMQWTIVTPGYRFDRTRGIVVAGAGFTRPSANGIRFFVHNGHERNGYFKYAVNVIRDSDGAACAVYDPYINNR